jgi:hypothetical protein
MNPYISSYTPSAHVQMSRSATYGNRDCLLPFADVSDVPRTFERFTIVRLHGSLVAACWKADDVGQESVRPTHIVSQDSCGGRLREAKGLWSLIEAETS